MKFRPLLIITLLLIGISETSCKRTPETIIRDMFSIDLSTIDHEVLYFREHWLLNGDGEIAIDLHFSDGLPDRYIDLILQRWGQPLPIPHNVPLYLNAESAVIENKLSGLYILWDMSMGDTLFWDYCLLVYDYDTKQLSVRIQCK